MTGNYEDSLKAFPVYSRDMIMSIKAGEIPRDLCEGIAAEAINKIDKIGEFKVESNRNYVEAVDEIMVTMVKHLYGGGVK
jgi:hypothetical protein